MTDQNGNLKPFIKWLFGIFGTIISTAIIAGAAALINHSGSILELKKDDVRIEGSYKDKFVSTEKLQKERFKSSENKMDAILEAIKELKKEVRRKK